MEQGSFRHICFELPHSLPKPAIVLPKGFRYAVWVQLMALNTSESDVEIAPAFDRNWYRVQKALQGLLALVLCSGIAGAFGGGWLSTSVVRVGPLEVTYERFARKSVPFRIKVRAVDQIHADRLQLTIGRGLVDHVGILRTIPTAASSSESIDGSQYVFAVAPGRGGEISIAVQPDRFGIFDWTIKAADLGEASLFQIIYP